MASGLRSFASSDRFLAEIEASRKAGLCGLDTCCWAMRPICMSVAAGRFSIL